MNRDAISEASQNLLDLTVVVFLTRDNHLWLSDLKTIEIEWEFVFLMIWRISEAIQSVLLGKDKNYYYNLDLRQMIICQKVKNNDIKVGGWVAG